jgi:hypothetical protein
MTFFDPSWMSHTMQTGLIDLGLVILGFVVGNVRSWKTPLLFTMFLMRLVKWWLETHPHGKEAAKKTNLDEEFRRRFSGELAELEKKFAVDKKGNNDHTRH